MTYVLARADEPFEWLYRRFKRQVDNAGVMRECRRRRHFISAAEERRAKRRRAERRRARQGV